MAGVAVIGGAHLFNTAVHMDEAEAPSSSSRMQLLLEGKHMYRNFDYAYGPGNLVSDGPEDSRLHRRELHPGRPGNAAVSNLEAEACALTTLPLHGPTAGREKNIQNVCRN